MNRHFSTVAQHRLNTIFLEYNKHVVYYQFKNIDQISQILNFFCLFIYLFIYRELSADTSVILILCMPSVKNIWTFP